ncbi:MAG: radical SAM protein [Candidatus Njordarchaeales archaeon]
MSSDKIHVMNMLKKSFENPIIRWGIRSVLKKDPRTRKTYLELILEDLSGENVRLPYRARIMKFFVRKAIERGAKAFDLSYQDAIGNFKDVWTRRALAGVLKGMVTFGVRKPFVPGAPFLVVWDYTYRCNLRCKHCYINAGHPLPEMTVEERKKALDIMADAGVVVIAFSGGEPILGPGILEMIKRADDYGMYTAMATNGTLLSEEMTQKLVKAGLKYVQISLDAPVPEVHDEFRGVPGAWERTVEGIKNALKAGLYVEISMTVTKLNYHLVPQMLEFVRKIGANLFMHFNFVPTGRGKEIVELDLSPEEREELLKLLAKSSLEGEVQAASTAPSFARVALELGMERGEAFLAGHFYRVRAPSKLASLAEFIGGCGAGRAYLALEPNGDIQPCVFLPIKVGNIFKDDFEELWRTNKVFEDLRNRELLAEPCRSCTYRDVCGGCRARAYGYFGDYLAADPGCVYAKDWWERILESLSKGLPSAKATKEVTAASCEKQ